MMGNPVEKRRGRVRGERRDIDKYGVVNALDVRKLTLSCNPAALRDGMKSLLTFYPLPR